MTKTLSLRSTFSSQKHPVLYTLLLSELDVKVTSSNMQQLKEEQQKLRGISSRLFVSPKNFPLSEQLAMHALVSGDKFRFQQEGFDMDLTYVTLHPV